MIIIEDGLTPKRRRNVLRICTLLNTEGLSAEFIVECLLVCDAGLDEPVQSPLSIFGGSVKGRLSPLSKAAVVIILFNDDCLLLGKKFWTLPAVDTLEKHELHQLEI